MGNVKANHGLPMGNSIDAILELEQVKCCMNEISNTCEKKGIKQ
jgi:hypothetical protein